MAEGRRYAFSPELDIEQILLEAKNRWLRPSEICEILRNHRSFQLTPDPPNRPPGGSLFLFDRKALRYFRKDGHRWRKKKDGKTVREAHEKLKAGSVDVLHCYYAHGEDNENFQRRSYWMLDGQLEHIVLVHYREVKEGSRSGIPRLLNTDPEPLNHCQSAQTSSAACSAHASSIALAAPPSNASSPSTANWNGQTPSSELEDVDSGDDFDSSSFTEPTSCSGFQIASLHPNDTAERNQLGCSVAVSSLYSRGLTDATGIIGGQINPYFVNQGPTLNLLLNGGLHADYRTTQETVGPYGLFKGGEDGRMFPCAHPQTSTKNSLQQNYKEDEQDFHANTQFQSNCGSHMDVATNGQSSKFETENGQGLPNVPESSLYNEHGELKKLDSFGRWMNNEIGKDCDDSLMASDSCNYWNTLDTQNDDKEVSSLSRQMQLDVDSLGPSLSQVQLFSILDFSPDWAFIGFETKVLISGTFLGGMESRNTARWCCMFGEVEVPAEVLAVNTLRCQAPAHVPGRVPFYVTSSDRLACSEVREFEYRDNPSETISILGVKGESEEELCLQIRFTKMILRGVDRKWLDCSLEKCEKCNLKKDTYSMGSADENDWGKVEIAAKAMGKNHENPRKALMQKLLKDRLYEWLVCKAHEGGKGPNILDDKGQGVIHLAAALGYEWAMSPIVASGISPSFRDSRGWTGLHWAAFFGREETIVALVRLGAAPGAVEDPTSKFPEGRTAADLASSRGHKGIAGYLAEADLTSHPSSLTLNENVRGNVLDNVSVNLAAEKAIETLVEQSVGPLDVDQEDCLSLRNSLAAVRNSAQAAARIQAALRICSFRQRELPKCDDDNSEISSELIAIASMNKPQKVLHFSDSLHTAAVRIQQKYRGWKGRKEFIKIRNRIVKIQAHVRGHQVRKQYKKVVWSVSIVEKAILRWRRKGAGLRGFQADKAFRDREPETGKTDEYEFLRVGREQKVAGVEKALARVQSMVRYREGRDQYMRLVTNFQKLQMGSEGASGKTQISEESEIDANVFASMKD
eukprot:TRINITY_DN2066_c0_g1_i4.p1 TRINITY_DN2066_c0_g1~~TRINITY_DN2066_c0_g1_i4.p1  ORF type:complete len:1029 (+),score=221.63 TRINITY_DN2066_c0_g1_i4:351-3437(+)